jgi:mRNA-degrading endonuclease RelE of RelBE toxin-antitoxin system
MIREIRTTTKFEKQYRKLPKKIKSFLKEKEIIFRVDPFDTRLSTHKLHGKNRKAWSFYVTPRFYRVKFVFLTNKSILFLEVGKHDIYK